MSTMSSPHVAGLTLQIPARHPYTEDSKFGQGYAPRVISRHGSPSFHELDRVSKIRFLSLCHCNP